MAEKSLEVGTVVTVIGDNRFKRRQGLVVDLNSDLEPEYGTIAVFFDMEVPKHLFSGILPYMKDWDGGVPTE